MVEGGIRLGRRARGCAAPAQPTATASERAGLVQGVPGIEFLGGPPPTPEGIRSGPPTLEGAFAPSRATKPPCGACGVGTLQVFAALLCMLGLVAVLAGVVFLLTLQVESLAAAVPVYQSELQHNTAAFKRVSVDHCGATAGSADVWSLWLRVTGLLNAHNIKMVDVEAWAENAAKSDGADLVAVLATFFTEMVGAAVMVCTFVFFILLGKASSTGKKCALGPC
jgi:hypothetical protein